MSGDNLKFKSAVLAGKMLDALQNLKSNFGGRIDMKKVPKGGVVADLRLVVSKLTGINAQNIAFCEVDTSKKCIEKLITNENTSLDDFGRSYSWRSNALVA
jgi:hypothetical protein